MLTLYPETSYIPILDLAAFLYRSLRVFYRNSYVIKYNTFYFFCFNL